MGNQNKKKSRDWFWVFIILLGILFIIIPWIINACSLSLTIPTGPDLGNKEWLGFWGSYLSGALGVVVTLIAFSLTYKQNEKQNRDIQEQNRIIQDQNIEMQKTHQEQMRLQSLPLINVVRAPRGSDPTKTIELNNDGVVETERNLESSKIIFIISNIGIGPAITVSLPNYKLGHISVNSELCYSIGFPKSDVVNIITTKITYSDREMRKYKQLLVFTRDDRGFYDVAELSPPELV